MLYITLKAQLAPMSDSDSGDLIRRAADGDGGAVDQLMRRHRSRLKQMVSQRMDPRVRARIDPSDVVQETLIKASKELPRYLNEQPIPFYPWLRRIAWQQLADLHRHHFDAQIRSVHREKRFDWGVSDNSSVQFATMFTGKASSPSAAVSREELCGRVRSVLDALPEIDREVLLQRHIEHLSIAEIAAVLDMSESAVYKRHARAITKVQASFEGGSSGSTF